MCLYVYPPINAGQRLGKESYRSNEYTSNYRRTFGRVDFYAVCVISKEVYHQVDKFGNFCTVLFFLSSCFKTWLIVVPIIIEFY